MTHHISGFVGPTEHLKTQTKDLANAKVIPLAQGMAFLPLGDELYEEIWEFNRKPMMWLANKFKFVSVAWIETDYYGGAGKQQAIFWKDGKKQRFRDCYGSIDNVMKKLGVVCEGENDEFDTLGLGKHRTNDSWLKDKRIEVKFLYFEI